MPKGRLRYSDGMYTICLEPTKMPTVEIPQEIIDKYNAAWKLLREIESILIELDNEMYELDHQ